MPLVVIAGLPHPISTDIRKAVEQNLRPAARVISPPSKADHGPLYPNSVLDVLLRSVTEFAERQIKSGNTRKPTPSQIVLAYVPSHDEEALLQKFDYFAYPVRLSRLSEFDDNGRQYRHDRRVATEYTLRVLTDDLARFAPVKRRLSSPSWKEPLLLPPCNFHLPDGLKIGYVFRRIRSGELGWRDGIQGIETKIAFHEDLKKRIPAGGKREVICDARVLAFPTDKGGHGLGREILPEAPLEQRLLLMRGAYRFGVPLQDGFHHDVQYLGRPLFNEAFSCSKTGERELSCSHANIYPNDFVRDGKE